MDFILVDLEGFLFFVIIMVVFVIVFIISGKFFFEENLQKIIEVCDWVFVFDEVKKKVLEFVESRMGYIVLNLLVVVGSIVVVKLMGVVGGFVVFLKMLVCNVQILGVKKKNLVGFLIVIVFLYIGFVFYMEIV